MKLYKLIYDNIDRRVTREDSEGDNAALGPVILHPPLRARPPLDLAMSRRRPSPPTRFRRVEPRVHPTAPMSGREFPRRPPAGRLDLPDGTHVVPSALTQPLDDEVGSQRRRPAPFQADRVLDRRSGPPQSRPRAADLGRRPEPDGSGGVTDPPPDSNQLSPVQNVEN